MTKYLDDLYKKLTTEMATMAEGSKITDPNSIPFEPLQYRIVVSPIEDVLSTKSGIILPQASQEKPDKGIVVAVGEGEWQDGVLIPPNVSVGDLVVFTKYGGIEIVVNDDAYLILSKHDILGRYLDGATELARKEK